MRQQFSMGRRVALALAASAILASDPSLAADPIALADNAPSSYTVQKGDTLWAISGRFLKDPWRWPDVWRMNRDQIRNPHRIYPGDVVRLDYTPDGQPRLSIAQAGGAAGAGSGGPERLSPRVRSELLDAQAIPSIPPGDIEPYLTRPVISDVPGLLDAPEIVEGRDRDRVVRGEGDRVYVVGLDPRFGDRWHIYRPGKALVGSSGEVLGYENRYIGAVRVERFADVSTVQITDATEEVFVGDRLLPVPRETLINYVPRAPETDLRGRIIAADRNASEMGRGNIVTLDLGRSSGLEVGHVMAIYKTVPDINDPRPDQGTPFMLRFLDQTTTFLPQKKLAVPDERVGLLFVFRVFDRVAYAVLLNTTDPIVVGDAVRRP
ncbi:MAG TPA: LysM peptidoglycan-binding domain-containing protein [Casimicrobiaceae bacterium]|nr:LysM peptidoglycan-binding domain-containing protein [Casimicrobiaceae bacterium]